VTGIDGVPVLAGVRVLVPRTRPRPGLLAARLRTLGADTVETVVSRQRPVGDPGPLLAALAGAGTLVLAGRAEVDAVARLLARAGMAQRALAGIVLLAADDEAAVALAARGLRAGPAGIGTGPGEAEPGQIGGGPAGIVVYAAGPVPAGTAAARQVVLLTDVPTEPDARVTGQVRRGELRAVAFASSTAAAATGKLYGPLPPGMAVAAMGRRTVEACRAAGIRVDAVAPQPGIYPLADAVAGLFATPGAHR
jgi:uroporphyrinogen III methyltransferase / synthase